jgi:hypothetical protein
LKNQQEVHLKQPKTPKQLPPQWIERIFVKLGAIYGHLWKSRCASLQEWEVSKNEWSEKLADLEVFEIIYALDKCAREVPMPPTLPQFLELARPKGSRTNHDAYKDFKPALMQPQNKELARHSLEQIKNILKYGNSRGEVDGKN